MSLLYCNILLTAHLLSVGLVVDVLLAAVSEEDVESPLLGHQVQVPVQLQLEPLPKRLQSDLQQDG